MIHDIEKGHQMGLLKRLKTRNKTEDSAREKIRDRFEAWLDGVLKDEAPLEGLDSELFSELTEGGSSYQCPDEDNDLYSTWAAMTALTQEVRLQGRAFRDLSGKIEPLSGMVADIGSIYTKIRETSDESRHLAAQTKQLFTRQEKEMRHKALIRARTEFLETLLDMRERLFTGLASAVEAQEKACDNKETGWFGRKRWFEKHQKETDEIVSSLIKGYELNIERLDDVLKEHGLSEISCQGCRFDPETMQAVDMEERDDMADGTVIDIYRKGYTMGNDVYRPAHVKVSKMCEEAGPLDKKEA